jgi:hypothetical protein
MEYDGPEAASAKFGRISASVASVPRTARAEDAPCSWKVCSKCFPAPKTRQSPTTPLSSREHRVAGDPVAALGAAEHDRYDESNFDHRHRDGEHDRAERLAELERQHLCVMDGREYGGAEEETGEDQDERGVGGNDMREFQRQQGTGTAQVQAGMEAWRGTGIGAFRCEDAA